MMTTPNMIDAMNTFDEETLLIMGEPALNIDITVVPVSEEMVQQQETKEDPLANEGARLRPRNPVIFSTAGSTAYIRDDVCEPSNAKVGNI
jgi:hypothetical protein